MFLLVSLDFSPEPSLVRLVLVRWAPGCLQLGLALPVHSEIRVTNVTIFISLSVYLVFGCSVATVVAVQCVRPADSSTYCSLTKYGVL